jgi:fucose permease
MTARRGLALADAGTCLALYWLCIAAGRLVLSLLPSRVSVERLLLALTVFAVAALGAALAAPGSAGARIGFALTGLGFSGIFPAIVALGGRYGGDAMARTSTILIAGAAIGNIIIPWAMAAIVGRAGLDAGMGFYLAGTIAMVGFAAVLSRVRHAT